MSQRSTSRPRGRAAWAALSVLALLGISFAASGAADPAQQSKVNRYIGAQKCKSCHSAKESGDQYGAWTHMKHAKAYEMLASEDAKRLGAAKGVAEPQKSDQCLECHVTGFGKPKELFDKGFDIKLGVQCESCHGPGEQHMKARVAAVGDEEEGEGFGDEEASKYTALPAGEVVNTPEMQVCLACHNDKSPSFKPFCFARANAEVRHVNPLKPRTPEELAKLKACGKGDQCTCKNGDDGCRDCPVPDPKFNKK